MIVFAPGRLPQRLPKETGFHGVGRLIRRHGGYECMPWRIISRKSPTSWATNSEWTVAPVLDVVSLQKTDGKRSGGGGLETPPYFFPEHVVAALAVGFIYMAKPVAVMYPAWKSGGGKSHRAGALPAGGLPVVDRSAKSRSPGESAKGEIGRPAIVTSRYFGGGWSDPPPTGTLENQLKNLIWCNDI